MSYDGARYREKGRQMKVKVFEVGSTLIDADPKYQEPAFREGLSGGFLATAIIDYTDAERSDISCDEYAIAHEDDGTLLWQGWLTGDDDAPAPQQAMDYLAGLAGGPHD